MAKKSTASAAARTPDLIVSRPISLLERDIKADVGGLFKSLGLAAAHIGSKKYHDLTADAGTALAALALKPDAGGLAWLLIRRSLLRAMQALTEESWLHHSLDKNPNAKELESDLDGALSRAQLTVKRDFFRQPGDLPLLTECTGWFRQWLIQIGFAPPKAASIASRLRTYFVNALNQEWREHPDFYAPIVVAASTPFTQAGERERAWEQYRAWLDQELDSPMFDEPFSLRQLYIPLRAYYENQPKDASSILSTEPVGGGSKKRIPVSLTDCLLNWVQSIDRDDACRVISGGPGSGKSSVAKMVTADVLEKTGWRALYIPLHRIKYKGEIISAIHQYIDDAGLLPGAAIPLNRESGELRLLLVFDGLDELAMLGKIEKANTDNFIRAVKELVCNLNTTALRLKVILTGRTVVMQGLESEFRKEGSVLHLCPYHVVAKDKDLYERSWDLLVGTDQRQLWWRKYGDLTGKGYVGLPDELDRKDLQEVSAEPLLNYLLALAYQSGELHFSQGVTQNQIYATLIHEVYQRRWAGGENFAVRGMEEADFQRVLEEIAVAAWHGDGRKTTIREVSQRCADASITPLLETFQDGAANGILRLFTAFFFRKAGERDQDSTFEFTHKSFGEYLVARRLVRLLADMHDELARNEKTYDRGWNAGQCLQQWGLICGPSSMSWRQKEFLRNEMSLASAHPMQWQGLIVKLINMLLRQGMPMDKLKLSDFKTMQNQARNAEESLLMALNSAAEQNRVCSTIDWPEPDSAGSWIRRLQGQRIDRKNVLTSFGLSLINFDYQMMHLGDFYNASLVDASFKDTGCYEALFERATLQRVNLDGGVFSKATFEEARCLDCTFANALLLGTVFNQAVLINVDFKQAKLDDASFKNTRLDNVSFFEAHLPRVTFSDLKQKGVSFEKALLHHANFEYADLTEVSFEEAHLERVKLTGASLQRACLRNAFLGAANLRQARLQGADLTGATLQGADLQWADLTGAILERCNLEGANLQFATLEGANLTGANIRGAIFQHVKLAGAVGLSPEWQQITHNNADGSEFHRRTVKTGSS